MNHCLNLTVLLLLIEENEEAAAAAAAQAEDEEEEDDEEDDEVRGDHMPYSRPPPILFTPNDVAQAFSHYTYWASGRKRLVCDLQGVYDEQCHELKLTDPVKNAPSAASKKRTLNLADR